MHRLAHPGPALLRFLDDEAQALDGFPVRPLVQHWLTPKSPAHSRPDGSAGRLLQQVLQCWVAALARQLATMPAGGSLALEKARQRARGSHDAIVRLLALVGPSLDDAESPIPLAPAPQLDESEGSCPRRSVLRRVAQPLHA